MDAEKFGAHHLRHVSVYPQIVAIETIQKAHPLLSSIQENESAKLSEKTKKTIEEGEIGVFGAEKYFNMKLDDKDSPEGYERENREDPPWMRSRSRPGTPSIRSESSYNSQTFLLRNSLRNYHHSNNQTRGKSSRRMKEASSVSFGGFRCNGPCSGSKSISTNRKTLSQTRNSCYHKSVTYDARRRPLDKPIRHPVEAKTKDFFASQIQKSDIAMNLERNLSLLTWDAVPNAAKNKNSSSIGGKTNEDVMSDASSDLFEIENITSSVYEPSEASVEWSVVTGSMADQSVVSDFADKRSLNQTRVRNPIIPVNRFKSAAVVEKGRSGGILSGCKSYKAVNVVESAYRNEKQAKVHQILERKFHTQVRIEDLDFL